MKIAVYEDASGPRIGVVLGDRIVDAGLEGVQPDLSECGDWGGVALR